MGMERPEIKVNGVVRPLTDAELKLYDHLRSRHETGFPEAGLDEEHWPEHVVCRPTPEDKQMSAFNEACERTRTGLDEFNVSNSRWD